MNFGFINYEKTYYYLILVLAFALPLSRALISLLVILLILVWLIEGNFRDKFNSIKNNKALLFLFLFLLLSFISILWTENLKDSIRPLRLLLYYVLIFVVATSFNPKYTYKVISSFLAGMFVSEIIAYGVFFRIWNFKDTPPSDPSPFMLHLEYSIFLAFASITLLNRLLSSKYQIKEKVFYGLFFLTVTGNLFLTMGRTGQVAFIFSIFVLSFIHFKFSLKSFFTSILFIISITTIAYNASSTFKSRVKQSTSSINQVINNNFSTSIGIRIAYFICVPNIIKKDPLLGIGIGDYQQELRKEIKKDKYIYLNNRVKNFISTSKPHCQYLLTTLQIGLSGLILFVLFVFYYYKIAKIKIFDEEIKQLAILFMTIFLVSFLTDAFLMKQFTLVLFTLFVGIFMSNTKQIAN